MRSEKEMLELLLKTAEEDDGVLAVFLNGSRTNKNVPRDIFQDYDVVFVVKDTSKYIENQEWINVFGERLYMQKPEELDMNLGKKIDLKKSYGYLIQLADGNRIDLHVLNMEYAKEVVLEDKLTKVLLDKNNILPDIPPPSDENYWVKRPTALEYEACCNEFWWCLNNVAKGLWREEILYVMDMIDHHIRPELKIMVTWYAGIKTNFSLSVGKSGKYLSKYIPEDIWKRFLSTYVVAEVNAVWTAVFHMCNLFEDIAEVVGRELNFTYDKSQAENSVMFLKNAERLPKDATEIL